MILNYNMADLVDKKALYKSNNFDPSLENTNVYVYTKREGIIL